MFLALLFLAVFQGNSTAVALQTASPIGLWQTVSDKTGQVQSLVRVYEERGRLFGRVEKVLVTEGVPPTCEKCRDERKGQPMVGLVIIRNMTKKEAEYRDGDILDPENGKVYRARMTLDSTNKHLTVRGYIGISLFGRSQTWQRVE
ncbi:MAG: DUF2147 domain-containing protein [Vicinamibacterales bacterium]